MGDRVLLDEPEVGLGVEAFHDDRRAPDPDGEPHGGLGGRVVERRRRQVDHLLAVVPEPAQEGEQRELERRWFVGERTHDPLGSSGRSRRVQHRCPEAFVVDRGVGQAGDGLGEVGEDRRRVDGVEASRSTVPVDHQHRLDARGRGDGLDGDGELVDRGDEQPGSGVDEDVRDLVGGQVRVDAGVVETRPLARPTGLQIATVVLHEDRQVVEPVESLGPEVVGQAIGAGLELRVGHGLTGGRHDETRLVGAALCVWSRIHRTPCC